MTEPLGSIAELREVLDAGEVSSVQLVGRALARAEALGTRLNAFLGLRSEGARADAARSDERRARGAVRSPLAKVASIACRFIQPSISTWPVSSCCATAGTRPFSS